MEQIASTGVVMQYNLVQERICANIFCFTQRRKGLQRTQWVSHQRPLLRSGCKALLRRLPCHVDARRHLFQQANENHQRPLFHRGDNSLWRGLPCHVDARRHLFHYAK